jgi:hypothetical protein
MAEKGFLTARKHNPLETLEYDAYRINVLQVEDFQDHW